MKILVVEDHATLAGFIRRALIEQAYSVSVAINCEMAADLLAEEKFDLVVLDIGLPDGSGLGLLRAWREAGFNEPVLILSARDAVDDRIIGLDVGADVYLAKPFQVDELLANVRALLRRQAIARKTVLTHRGLTLDLAAHTAMLNGAALELTAREFALLEIFLQNAGRILTRTFISEKIWQSHEDVDTNLLDVYMSRLRARIETPDDKYFRTVRGVGYQLQ
ncbi:MAG: response regulator transcription factor [Sphingomonadales bacterium]|nr:response regulator transcription factor [Sphingomonadales bacterium]